MISLIPSVLKRIKRFGGEAILDCVDATRSDFSILKKAIEIEDAYRTQFKIMYPGKKVFSRLGQENYNSAKNKLKKLLQ